MSDPFMAEIKIISWNYAPKAWAFCNGQILPINQNQALFALLGTTYGGDGKTSFALPNLRGRVPISFGAGHTLGETGGSSAVTLTQAQMPAHNHFLNATTNETNQVAVPNGALLSPGNNQYSGFANPTTLVPTSVTNVGGSQPHNNMMPYLVLNFIIALQGIFPSQN